MKSIEDFIHSVEHDAHNTGHVDNASRYAVMLDKDGLIKDIKFASMPSNQYLDSCQPKERELLLKWLKFKVDTMKKWCDIYNESVMSYNDYCGQRAGESDELFEMIMEGKQIANIIPFRTGSKRIIHKEATL